MAGWIGQLISGKYQCSGLTEVQIIAYELQYFEISLSLHEKAGICQWKFETYWRYSFSCLIVNSTQIQSWLPMGYKNGLN